LLLFVVFYRFADALALSLNTTFLLRGMHFSLLTVGSVAKITSTVSVLLGSVIAGFLIPKMGLYRSLWWFGWLQLVSILGFCVLSLVGHDVITMAIVMFADFFCGGLGSVAFVVLLMGLCDQRFSATQYAILSALSAVTRVVIGPVAASIVGNHGWLDFYLLSFFLGIPVMVLLFVMRKQINRIEKSTPDSDEADMEELVAS
jgi:PAT family beta-lactamase induction signal transducer AmpG